MRFSRPVDEPMYKRLHWGCAHLLVDGWVNSDVDDRGQEHVGDLLDGLPWRDRSFEYIVTNHALQMVAYHDLGRALRELKRVLREGGVLRILVPDLLKAVESFFGDEAMLGGVIDDKTEPTGGGKLCAYVTWYSTARSVFCDEALHDLGRRAGFTATMTMPFGITMAPDPACASLDSRPMESLIVEMIR